MYDTDSGTQIQELRRGSDHADIYCLAFDPVSKYIACSSDKGTIHIFQVRADVHLAAQSKKQLEDAKNTESQAPNANSQSEDKSTSNTKSMLWFMKGVLPKYFESEWSFSQFRIVDAHSICTIKDNKIIAISNEGNYYVAEIDEKNGGECKKL